MQIRAEKLRPETVHKAHNLLQRFFVQRLFAQWDGIDAEVQMGKSCKHRHDDMKKFNHRHQKDREKRNHARDDTKYHCSSAAPD
jgi:hypothetical protein